MCIADMGTTITKTQCLRHTSVRFRGVAMPSSGLGANADSVCNYMCLWITGQWVWKLATADSYFLDDCNPRGLLLRLANSPCHVVHSKCAEVPGHCVVDSSPSEHTQPTWLKFFSLCVYVSILPIFPHYLQSGFQKQSTQQWTKYTNSPVTLMFPLLP